MWFREQGATVATFAPIDAEESRFVAEGDSDAVRVVRSIVEDTPSTESDRNQEGRQSDISRRRPGGYSRSVASASPMPSSVFKPRASAIPRRNRSLRHC